VLDLIEPVEPDDGNLKAEAASPVNAPAEKCSKLGVIRNFLDWRQKDACLTLKCSFKKRSNFATERGPITSEANDTGHKPVATTIICN
jgi:hypothetical protein